MAANKFASMLHRNSSRLTLVLVYVLLEWILIAMILVNSLFSYLIVKYTDYFGLKRPCVLCSRIDHGRDKRIRKDMICEEHASEISGLGFCLKHQTLVELGNMCHDCGSLEVAVERSLVESRCSCCDVSLKQNKFVSPMMLIENRNLCFSEFTHKEGVVLETDKEEEAHEDKCSESEQSTKEEIDEEDDIFMETDSNIDHLVSSELNLSGADEVKNADQSVVVDEDLAIVLESQSEGIDVVTEIVAPFNEIDEESDSSIIVKMETHEDAKESSEEGQKQDRDGVEVEDESDSGLVVEMEVEELEDVTSDVAEEAQTRANDGAEVESNSEIFVKMEIGEHEDAHDDQSEEAQIDTIGGFDDESDSEFYVKKETEDHEDATAEVINSSEEVSPDVNNGTEDQKSSGHSLESSSILETLDDLAENEGSSAAQKELERLVHPEHEDLVKTEKLIQVEQNDDLVLIESQTSSLTSVEGKVILHESAEDFSLIEKLKAALEAETRALNEVCEELEQERNDTAEASTQTMAMITRLQEEKAALKLEASQYQRMMDEQLEFDQEALQLLNEIIVRREKENQELEKELELYRKRFAELERRKEEHNNMVVTNESVSVTCSSFGDQDSDGISTEDEEYHHHQQHQSIKADDPLMDFEDERLAILNQLNELEQKLFELNEGELQHSRKLKPKKLIPLFDEVACNNDEEDGLLDVDAVIAYEDTVAHDVKNKLKIEEEVEHVYERLNALEEDKQFLVNCMYSLQKGDQGMSLVQEILLHLRALRRMEI